MKKYHIALVGVVVVSILSIVAAQITTKSLKEDYKLVEAVSLMSDQIQFYITAEGQLPESMSVVLEACKNGCKALKEVSSKIEYRVVSESSYEVCATFERASSRQEDTPSSTERVDLSKHKVGRNCVQAAPYGLDANSIGRRRQLNTIVSPSPTPKPSSGLQNRSAAERLTTGCAVAAPNLITKVKLISVGSNAAGQYEVGYTNDNGQTVTYLVCEKAFAGTFSKAQLKPDNSYFLNLNTIDGVVLSIQ